MTEFIEGLTEVVSGVFDAIVNALASTGTLIFATNAETGAITGPTPFGWLMVLVLGIPLATWAFGKVFNWIKSVRAK